MKFRYRTPNWSGETLPAGSRLKDLELSKDGPQRSSQVETDAERGQSEDALSESGSSGPIKHASPGSSAQPQRIADNLPRGDRAGINGKGSQA
jgi:hypothetical protein